MAAGFLLDITLKRAEDELCREIALRIPAPDPQSLHPGLRQ
ncbi:protein of unknown function [Methylacidimicrobium sp. AP8]|nr:protein of unknown function [Methylacidimicrobium sp. AP8]